MTDPSKTCETCPSYLGSAQEVVAAYGRAIGSPLCYRFGTVLGKPGGTMADDRKLREHVGNNCSQHGLPKPGQLGRDHLVMLPLPAMRSEATDPVKKNISSCAQCLKFVPELKVGEELGWNAGMCTAKGKLIMASRLSQEYKGCEWREFGVGLGTTVGMNFLPEYETGFAQAGADPVRQYFASRDGEFIEPGDWPTDEEVDEGERAAGIKAWRKIVDPHGSGKFVMLPVYDESSFDDADRMLIPRTGSDEHPELYVDHFGGLYGLAVAWLELKETPVFWGQPGVGKTELLRHAAWIMCVPFRRLSITADSQIEDVAGSKEFSPDKGTYFVYGEVPNAWIKPGVLCIDEPNVAKDPAVWHFLRPMTDNSKQLVLTMNGNERLPKNEDCYMAMAMNPAWDIRNVGALEIADADANRLFHTFIPMPPEALEKEIIQERVRLDGWELSNEQMKMVMGIATDLRGLADQSALPITWAIRQQIKVARALAWFTPPVAYRRAAGDFLDPEQLETLMGVINTYYQET